MVTRLAQNEVTQTQLIEIKPLRPPIFIVDCGRSGTTLFNLIPFIIFVIKKCIEGRKILKPYINRLPFNFAISVARPQNITRN